MYLALYRKWRPKTFSDVVSQEHITRTLQNQVRLGKTAHAYLFTGSRGTGKTTCSKILAKAVNCLHPVDGNPCLKCEICRGIEDGSILDVTEMDAASNNGVDDIRDLRDEASYTPSVCKYRVYIIDEVHMLSPSAFNALLKIMEEPPPHILFILATTEIHKVPQTIISRCQQFDFRRFRPADIAARLLEVSSQEDFTLTDDAAKMISRLADGGMRDALSLLDQCAAYEDHIDIDTVRKIAGVAGSEHIFALADKILRQDTAGALRLVDELYENAKGIERLCTELIAHFRDVLLCRSVSDPTDLVVCLPDELEQLRQEAASVSLDRLMNIMASLQKCLDSLSRSSNKKVELEMTVISLCSEKKQIPSSNTASQSEIAALTSRVARLEQMISEGYPVRFSAPPEGVSVRKPAPRTPPAEHPAAPHSPAPSEKIEALPEWDELLQEMSASEPALYALVRDSSAARSGKVVIIQSPNPMLKQLLLTDNIGARLADMVEQKLGSRYRLRISRKDIRQAQEQLPALDDILQKASSRDVEIHVLD